MCFKILQEIALHIYNNKLIKQLYLDEPELKAVLIMPEEYREGLQHSSPELVGD